MRSPTKKTSNKSSPTRAKRSKGKSRKLSPKGRLRSQNRSVSSGRGYKRSSGDKRSKSPKRYSKSYDSSSNGRNKSTYLRKLNGRYENSIPSRAKIIPIEMEYSYGKAPKLINNPLIPGTSLTIHFPIDYNAEYVKTIKIKAGYKLKDLLRDIKRIALQGDKQYSKLATDYVPWKEAFANGSVTYHRSSIRRSGNNIYIEY